MKKIIFFPKNCPEFYRKYFIRDYHHLDNNPIYFFASASPFVRQPVFVNHTDDEIIRNLVERPMDTMYSNSQNPNYNDDDDQDVLKKMEDFQLNNLNRPQSDAELNSVIFNETHTNIPLKEYIRKWSNWVIDFHWVFTLKFFIDSLPTNKLYNFIKLYPTLDNFILHWMWWSYTLSKDLERFTNDPFCAAGTMPWLTNRPNTLQTILKSSLLKSKDTVKIPPSKYYQYSDSTIMFINSLLFPNEPATSNGKSSNSGYNSSANENSKSIGLSNRTKSFNINTLNKVDTEINNFLKLTSLIQNSYPANRRLHRSKSFNVLLDEIGDKNKTNSTKLSSKKHQKSLSKSTTSSPYVNGKGKLNTIAQNSSKNFKNLELNYENVIYQLKSNDFDDVILKRLDSFSSSKRERTSESLGSELLISSLENLVDMVTADSDRSSSVDSGNEDTESGLASLRHTDEDQDKTIVFELGGLNNDNDDLAIEQFTMHRR